MRVKVIYGVIVSKIWRQFGGQPGAHQECGKRVAKYRAKGDQIVVVVSAMSGVTDNLIKLARKSCRCRPSGK